MEKGTIKADTYNVYNMVKSIRPSQLSKFESPKKFKYDIDHPVKTTDAMKNGLAFHTYMSDPENMDREYLFADRSKMPFPGSTMNKTENKQWLRYLQQQAIDQNKILIQVTPESNDELQQYKTMRQNVLENKINVVQDGSVLGEIWVRDILEEGLCEMSYYCKDEQTGIDVKFRPDFSTKTRSGIVFDFKSTASLKWFHKQVEQYCIKETFYKDYLQLINGFEYNKVGYLAVQYDKSNGYCDAAIFFLSDEYMNYARFQYRNTMNVIADCYEKNEWPGYSYGSLNGFEVLELPRWLNNGMY